MKILDSDHCVAILRAQLDLTGRVAPDEELASTAISVGELVHGAITSQHAALVTHSQKHSAVWSVTRLSGLDF
jgi:predicted nucleic acid-binding protein